MIRSRRSWIPFATAILVVGAAVLLARGGPPAGPTLEERATSIASGLRCPVCQNLSVADSPSRLAGEMRTEIEAQLRAGRTPDEVRAYFVERYGEWVLLAPARRGLNLIPWLLPVVGALVGVGAWAAVVRRRPTPPEETVTDPERRRIERELGAVEEPG